MKIKISSESTTKSTFTVTYNSEECHAGVKFHGPTFARNKRCETIAEAIDLARCLEANADTSHLDIH